MFGTKTAVAQQIAVGAGLNAGSIPRALSPLCASPRRLNGAGLSATAGMTMPRARVSATVDYLSNGGAVSVADCVPLPPGISVDSAYADAGTSAVSFSGAAWLRVAGPLDAGVEAGWVHDHESWFIAPALAAQFSRVRVEASARLHSISFEEVTRDYDGITVREVSRTDETERAWGFTVRAVFLFGQVLRAQ
jgi:hypothetical protein